VARHAAVAASLASLSDERLGALLDAAPVVQTGIGGTAVVLHVDGTPVFVKRVPLTGPERRPEHAGSTANLFGLPPACQYGIGSPGFGGWREVAANVMTTRWVLERDCEDFPLLHHWRVLPGTAPVPDELADIEERVGFWGGSTAVRDRLGALARCTAAVVLCLEFVPHTLHDWLSDRLAAGDDGMPAAAAMAERLRAVMAFMNANGLIHFDGHLRNVLTDGTRLYVADLGLATSPGFALDPAERRFLAATAGHDDSYVVTEWVNHLLITAGVPARRRAVADTLRRFADGGALPPMPAAAAAQIRRHAPVALVMNDFYCALFAGAWSTPYPAALSRPGQGHRPA
jgi:hypothetical protein